MRHTIYLIFFALLFCSCRNNEETKEMNAYFRREIKNRIEILDSMAVKGDSLKFYASEVDHEIENIILMSKDIENLPAAVNKGNAYFRNLSNEYGLNNADFTLLSTDMHVDHIAAAVRQNELNLFNQVIFKNNPSKATIYTAH